MEKIDGIFEHALTFWPYTIDITDGKFIDEISGFKSDNLSKAWDNTERESSGNDWNEVSVWVIYKLLHQKATRDFQSKIFRVSPSQLNKHQFKRSLFEELQQGGYGQMLNELTR